MGKRAAVEEEAEVVDYAVKRRRRSSASHFFDEYAAVASDDDVEDDEYEGDHDFIDHASEFPEEDDRRIHNRRPRLLAREEDMEEDIDEMERRLKVRYMSRDNYQVEYDDQESQVHQQTLLPSVRDPKLFMVKCAIGHEKEAAISLMHKSIGKGPDEVQIKSVIALDHVKSYIYIEAYKEAHVREICKGMRNIYAGQIKLVPLKEMTDILTVDFKAIDLARGKYKGVKSCNGVEKIQASSQGHFVKGDRVIVVKGDLKNLKGRVEKVEKEIAHIKPNEKGLPRTLAISKTDLCKYFEPGNQVKAVSGVSEGTTGMVVAVEGRVLIVVSDTTKETLRLFADNVVESSEVSSGGDPSSPMRLPRGGGPTSHPGGMHRGERGHHAVVKVCVGPYKGYKGRVLNSKGTMVLVELESQMKVITVDRLSISDCVTRDAMGSGTPVHPSRTPLHPIMTSVR